MPRIDQVPGQQTAPASELHDEAVAFQDGCEQREDPRCAVVGVEPEAEVMDASQVGAVVGLIRRHAEDRPTATCAA
jgi:hypothetical protein